MSELEDFFAEPIEPQGQGLEEAFAPPVSVESEADADEDISLEEIFSMGQTMVDQADAALLKLDDNQANQPTAEEITKEEGVEGLKDTGQLLGQSYAAFKATPGPIPVKTAAAMIAGTPPAKRVVDKTIDEGVKAGAEQAGKELGVNEPQNIKDNLEAFRTAAGKAEEIKPMPSPSDRYRRMVQGIRN